MNLANEFEMHLRLTLIGKSETVYKSNVQSAKLSKHFIYSICYSMLVL